MDIKTDPTCGDNMNLSADEMLEDTPGKSVTPVVELLSSSSDTEREDSKSIQDELTDTNRMVEEVYFIGRGSADKTRAAVGADKPECSRFRPRTSRIGDSSSKKQHVAYVKSDDTSQIIGTIVYSNEEDGSGRETAILELQEASGDACGTIQKRVQRARMPHRPPVEAAGIAKRGIKMQVGDDKPFKCTVCQEAFTTYYTVKKHIMLGHPPSTKEAEKQKEKAPRTSRVLDRTDKERQHKCRLCEQAFYTSKHLEQHLWTHTDERPFSCELCGRGFKQIGTLRTHMFIHTGEKPYKCDVCGWGFTTSTNAKRHKITAHYKANPDKDNTSK